MVDKSKTISITITAAVVVDGQIITPGETVAVDEAVAKDLLRRERAKLNAADDDDKPLSKMTKAELLEEAEYWNLDVSDNLTKAQLVEAIEKAEAE
ncbi:hypothetical protein TRP8649_01390 [Pelagimonas phthalicica]|uniref:Rho termination factor N-terminal domain-containing protein n=1 Tax=Pelagimonas phthalicica TaxID=1037362 RepID=A0A238JAW9_9RHOB|nr:hypothetical protein [Pelagimonas phthalicica]TDS94188.1 hypothetical protein CLV87_0682 [Pelagimonas phthalicica]SMX27287.1 hypothetical protein TRP8649_01390 [Pelagimonas phthalicica]